MRWSSVRFLVASRETTVLYSKGRQWPFENVQIFEDALRELVSSFSETWLTSSSDHTLQILWGRKDFLASIELFYIGNGILKIKYTSPDQLKQNIKLLKSNDHGTMAGAVWEIILAAALHNPPNQISRLLGPRKPTYDVDIETIGGVKTRVSIKNFGQSKRDRRFVVNFEKIEKVITDAVINHSQIMIFRVRNYPSPQEWASLIRNLVKLIKSQKYYLHYLVDGWDISISPLGDDQIKKLVELENASIYRRKVSYTLFIEVPFYKNEDKNIESNLMDACSDLINNGSIESEMLKNSLFIHLPEYVSIEDYENYCKDFYLAKPDAPISYITLLQPAYTTDHVNDEGFLAINHAVIERPNKLKLINKLNVEFPLGTIVSGIKILSNMNFEIPDHHYTMQSGHIYVDYGDMTRGGKMKVKSIHGIIIDAIGEINNEKILISNLNSSLCREYTQPTFSF